MISSAPTWLQHQINPGPPQPFLLLTRMLSSFIPTDKMKFSYNVVVVSNSRRLDESGDLNSHDGRCSSSTTRFRHPLKSHQNFDSFDFPRSGENGNRLRRRKMGITFVVVRLFPQRLLLIELLLAPLNFVLAWTWLLKLVFTWGNIWKRNNVRCRIFIFGICSIPSCSNLVLRPRHWGCALFVFVFRACGRRCAVGNRSLHGGGTAQANRHGGGTVQTRDRRIIERPNRKGKSEFNNVPVTWLWLLRHALRSTRIPSEMRIRVMDENVTLWMKRP